jgi:DNA-binding XRE family transcriptional regulator
MNPIYHDLRTYRKQSLLNQKDIADILGNKDVAQICRHETGTVSPQLELALLYHIIFQKPVQVFFHQHMQFLIRRLRLRIPNIIDELKCSKSDEKKLEKIAYLQSILSIINASKYYE